MTPDREEAATGISAEAVLDEMQRATQSLRDQAWKMSPASLMLLIDLDEKSA